MRIVDLNVLLYAVNESAPHHDAVLQWWEQALGGEEAVGLPWVVLLGFLRISTNPAVFPQPLSPEEAIGKVDVWLSLENTKLVHEREGHWDALRELLSETGAAGNLTTDAHLAALAITHGAVLVSCDADFGRFRGLRWHNPVG